MTSLRNHFISGLPRSGSTMLSAILRQNPRFHATATSPVGMMLATIQQKMSGNHEYSRHFSDDRRLSILRGIVESYYRDRPQGSGVIFDTNRSWTGRLPLLERMYPGAKIVCCVREIGWIIDSVERALVGSPVQLSALFNFNATSSVYARADSLMNPESGLIGSAWTTLREAWFGKDAGSIIVVRYESLVQDPGQVMGRLYDLLGEEPYRHDFSNVAYDEPEYDAQLGLPGLHKVRTKVEFIPRQTCIPPDLFAKYSDANFWTRPELNFRSVVVL